MDLFSAQTYEAVRRPLLEAETLPPACYTSEEFFKREVETIFMREWNFIGRADYIAKSGDYYTVDFVGVPLLVMRGADGHVRAFVNSCRHRGAKVAQGEGNARKAIKCPYHGWVYGLDGELLGCAGMKATKNFDPADFPLLSVKTALWGGFIFINFDAEGESLESFLGDITTVFESYHLENMVCTQRKHTTYRATGRSMSRMRWKRSTCRMFTARASTVSAAACVTTARSIRRTAIGS
jgi:phenylpropionate dioxygenase-like ring-hydroxylating dioxygenase large terminal subunit